MIRLTEKLFATSSFEATLSLPIDIRIKSRARVTLDNGQEAGLFLERGSLLRDGDLISAVNGPIVKVIAAKETVSTIYCDSQLQLARAAYHLGNRHIPLQIEQDWLRYQQDNVLDDMLKQMGLEVFVEQAPFEPEAGAYQQQLPSHGHSSN